MSLNEVEVALQNYANEIEEIQAVLRQSHNNLIRFIDEHHELLPPSWHQSAQAELEEIGAIESNINSQLLIDMRDATQFRLSVLRRYLHES